MLLTVYQLQLLQAIASVELVDHVLVEPSYQAIAVTIGAGPRVAFIADDGIVEYSGDGANLGPWPANDHSRDRLRALYPTLAARQEAL